MSESLVPLFLAMPGTAFVDDDGQQLLGAPNFVNQAVATETASQKLLIEDATFIRNWHMSQLTSAALKVLRE